MVGEHNLERHMGCMPGFFHIFDRHHILAGKRLPPPEPENNGVSHVESSPERVLTQSPTPKTPLPLPVLELKEGTRTCWKFSRETPRLSLDSRAVVDAKGTLHPTEKQRRSTSVVARLMGLDEPILDPELRRSASESRDLPQHRFFDTNSFQLKQLQHPNNDDRLSNGRDRVSVRGMGMGMREKKGLYDWGDFFPEPKKSISMHGEIEKRLKMRGIDEPSKDLHALKQILEALQLKGLLHSSKYQSPIVVMKPNRNRTNSPPPASTSPRRHRPDAHPNLRSQSPPRSPNRMRKTIHAEKVSPVNVHSVYRRNAPPEHQVTSRSPKITKATYHNREEKMDTVSDTNNSQRFKTEEYKEGRSLLERCDKLLNSIAEMTAATTTTTTTELQPSPVSVLDSSFYKDESSCSPSPVMKRSIDYKGDSEDDMWIGGLRCGEAKCEDSEDFLYVSEIVRACNYFSEDKNLFLLLEKRQYLKGNDTSKASTLRRRLIFDTIHEILNRNQRLPPWNVVSLEENKLDRIWSEFRRIRERKEESEELFEVICGVLRKDMAEDAMNECPVEMGGVVLDIERLVFKDLIGETIRDLASFKGPTCKRVSALRRKLMF